MAGKRALNADFRLDDSAGTLQDLSRKVKSVDFSFSLETLDATTFQAPGGNKEFVNGFSDNKFTIRGNADSVIRSHIHGIRGQEPTVSFQIGPEGSTAGNQKYTGECFLTEYSENPSVSGVIEFTANFQATGNVTLGTY